MKFGPGPFASNQKDFLDTPPPKNSIAVHTHVLPWLIDWAKTHKSSKLTWIHTHHCFYYPTTHQPELDNWKIELNEVGAEALAHCDIPLSVSRWQQKYIREKLGIHCWYLPNGVDVRKCDSANANRFFCKNGVKKPFILWVGNDDPVKNPWDFLAAAEQIREHQFVMIGGLSQKQLKENQTTSPPNLLILPPLSHSDTLDAILASQLLVVTSHREGLPTLVLEAMTLSKPIVIPDEDGCMGATYGDTHATIYTRNSVESLVNAIRSTLPQSSRPDSRTRVLQEYDWRVIAKKLQLLYLGNDPRDVCQ